MISRLISLVYMEIFFCFQIWKLWVLELWKINENFKSRFTNNIIYSCKYALNERIHDCKLAMHYKCFILNLISPACKKVWQERNRSDYFGQTTSCCHHSLKDLCIHIKGAWWKPEKYYHHQDIINYPKRCFTCHESFSVGYLKPLKK